MSFQKILLFKLIVAVYLLFQTPNVFAMEEEKRTHSTLQLSLKKADKNKAIENLPEEPFHFYQYPHLDKFIFLMRAEITPSLMRKFWDDRKMTEVVLYQRMFCENTKYDKPFLMITDDLKEFRNYPLIENHLHLFVNNTLENKRNNYIYRLEDRNFNGLPIQQEEPSRFVKSICILGTALGYQIEPHTVESLRDSTSSFWHHTQNRPVSETISEVHNNIKGMFTYERFQEYKPFLKKCAMWLITPPSPEEVIIRSAPSVFSYFSSMSETISNWYSHNDHRETSSWAEATSENR